MFGRDRNLYVGRGLSDGDSSGLLTSPHLKGRLNTSRKLCGGERETYRNQFLIVKKQGRGTGESDRRSVVGGRMRR